MLRLLLLLAALSYSAAQVLPTPPSLNGPNNGGHFRYATVSWTKLEHNPPKIHFTIEAAFRRDFSSVNFKGSGQDGFLVVGDMFKPSGLETIMFDFGDGAMLTPITFTVEAWSSSEDWVQGRASFNHTYAVLSSQNPFKYVATFKGCCRLSTLEVNADTSWSLSTVLNVRDDLNSPRATVLPVQTMIKKQRPSDPEPYLYVPGDDNIFSATAVTMAPTQTLKTFEIMGNIGHAPSIIQSATAPKNLPNLYVEAATGRIYLAAGPVFSSAMGTTKCTPASACNGTLGNGNIVPGLKAGMYNAVIQLRQGNSTAPVEFMIKLVEEDMMLNQRMPVMLSATNDLFYPAYNHLNHVAYLGFPMKPFTISATSSSQAVTIGFTNGRLPVGAMLSTITGGTSVMGYQCINGSHYCMESPTTICNGTSTPGCSCVPPDNGKACAGPQGSSCNGEGVCMGCWSIDACPTSQANMEFSWTPVAGQEGTAIVCFDAVQQRDASLCTGPEYEEFECTLQSSPSQCINIEVLPDPAPMIWSTYEQDLDPYENSGMAYLGRELRFTVYANDTNCGDMPVISMGDMPPGVMMTPQQSNVTDTPFTVTSYIGETTTTQRACPTQMRVFSWKIPHTFGGYIAEHCFYATDSCGEDDQCSGGLHQVELCIEFKVAKCKYAVNLEQSIVEVASIFGSDWIHIWNLNELKSPDYILFKNQVLNVGRLYSVAVGDSVSKIARRMGTSEKSILFLNYELGVVDSTNITIGQELCLIANSCFGDVQSIWDENPVVDESLERWYAGVKSAYDALQEARAEQLESMKSVDSVA